MSGDQIINFIEGTDHPVHVQPFPQMGETQLSWLVSTRGLSAHDADLREALTVLWRKCAEAGLVKLSEQRPHHD